MSEKFRFHTEYMYTLGVVDPSIRGQYKAAPLELNLTLERLYDKYYQEKFYFKSDEAEQVLSDYKNHLVELAFKHNLQVKNNTEEPQALCLTCTHYQYRKQVDQAEIMQCNAFRSSLTKDSLSQECNQYIDKSLIPAKPERSERPAG